ncbi:MAG: DUF1508 domain-containing protein [Gemmataceae bacterium]|nr:DUF1508 domain-containing protein [Gemmataceae bacterium]
MDDGPREAYNCGAAIGVKRRVSFIVTTYCEGTIMRKLLGTLFLAGAAALVFVNTSDSLAQAKKAKGGVIEVSQGKDGKWRFSIRNADGKYLGGTAVGHATEKAAKEIVEELKEVIAKAPYVTKKAKD